MRSALFLIAGFLVGWFTSNRWRAARYFLTYGIGNLVVVCLAVAVLAVLATALYRSNR
jgi:hypothetical protein